METMLTSIRAEAPLWPLSVEAYHALGQMGLIPEKTELLYGFVYHKMPKSPAHRLLFMRLLRILLGLCPDGFHVQPEPDLAIIHGTAEDYPEHHPTTAELAVEICVTSQAYDLEKLRAYATAGVKEVWLVLGPERRVEVFRHPEAGRYGVRLTIAPEATLACATLPAVSFPVTELFPA